MKCLIASTESAASKNLFHLLTRLAPEHEWGLTSTLSSVLPDVDIIFFFRWPRIVSPDAMSSTRAKLVVFHTSDLPHGRGGSPIQNQIVSGSIISRVNAIAMTSQVDAGDIYCSQDITLQGTADDIWMAISHAACRLAMRVIEGAVPRPQVGEPSFFKRRRDNSLPRDADSLVNVHSFVQMLDGEGYPGSHIDHGNLRITLTRSSLRGDHVLCDARITLRDKDESASTRSSP